MFCDKFVYFLNYLWIFEKNNRRSFFLRRWPTPIHAMLFPLKPAVKLVTLPSDRTATSNPTSGWTLPWLASRINWKFQVSTLARNNACKKQIATLFKFSLLQRSLIVIFSERYSTMRRKTVRTPRGERTENQVTLLALTLQNTPLLTPLLLPMSGENACRMILMLSSTSVVFHRFAT